MDHFKLVSQYQPTGDQPEAIDSLVAGIENGIDEQVLPVSYTHLTLPTICSV